ncbi:MAG: addiction module antitoxin [Bacteroidota bacterium]|nr:addiction module antitoxin [Bacteroidota bacterium]
MEITIKLKNESELKRIKRILKGEKINVLINGNRKLNNTRVPNKKTLETFRKTDKGEDLVVCKDVNDFFKKLGI